MIHNPQLFPQNRPLLEEGHQVIQRPHQAIKHRILEDTLSLSTKPIGKNWGMLKQQTHHRKNQNFNSIIN